MSFTEEEFTAALEKAVEEKGADYTYPALEEYDEGYSDYYSIYGECKYSTSAGDPACIIGQALHNIDPDLMPKNDLVSDASTVLIRIGVPSSVAYAADQAQKVQDGGGTWGEALAAYKNELFTM